MDINTIEQQTLTAAKELCDAAKLKKGDIVVIGCSSSEIMGDRIGTNSAFDTAKCVYEALASVFDERGIFIAAQCCEHLNRAIIIEADAAGSAERVNVIPQKKAGGSFATNAYSHFKNPVVLEHIRADAGLDIGQTLIGMHLKEVAVPLRLTVTRIGEAVLTAARVRPKFIGGCRAVYDESLM